MANSGKRDEEVYDRMDRFDAGDLDDSLADESATSARSSGDGRLSENGIGLMERLTDVLVERGDGDLLLQQSNHEDMLLQWLQALDMQVIGACRADERLTPLLKLNAPGGAADDRLLAYLSQHFEPSEVGMLARCFCMPLVSIRVGKIEKQGTLLFPTSARGNLNLILLPTSDLRLSFVGDDGQTERIYTLLSHGIESSMVEVEEMSEDATGRSFLVKIPDGREFFFWCSEKSKLLGDELLRKMRDLLKKRPSVADLTGINESRLGCFATSVRTYLAGPSLTSARASVSGSPPIISSSTSNCHNNARENYPPAPNLPLPQQMVTESSSSSLTVTAADNLPDAVMMETTLNSDLLHRSSAEEPKSSCEISLDFLESLSEITMPPSFRPICLNQQPVLSPYYCWCPPSHPSNESIFTPLPPHPSLSLSDLPTTLDFPTTFLPDPFPNMVNSHQNIPTFTPLMCDLPIVHIPVIDVGQGYLVTAGATIPPLHPKLVNHHHPLIPEPNSSALEEGARETLRLLLGGSSALAMASASPGGENIELSGGTRDATAVGIGLISLPRIPGLDCDKTAGAEVNDDDDEPVAARSKM